MAFLSIPFALFYSSQYFVYLGHLPHNWICMCVAFVYVYKNILLLCLSVCEEEEEEDDGDGTWFTLLFPLLKSFFSTAYPSTLAHKQVESSHTLDRANNSSFYKGTRTFFGQYIKVAEAEERHERKLMWAVFLMVRS